MFSYTTFKATYVIGNKHLTSTATFSTSKQKPENIVICHSNLRNNPRAKLIPQVSTIEASTESLKKSKLNNFKGAGNKPSQVHTDLAFVS